MQKKDTIWPPLPENQTQPDRARYNIRPGFQALQVFVGFIIGASSDFFLQGAGFDALVRLKLIALTDAFEGTYSHSGRQLLMDRCVFVGLLIGFLCLRRRSRFPYFTNTAFVTHCIIGGLYTLLLIWLS